MNKINLSKQYEKVDSPLVFNLLRKVEIIKANEGCVKIHNDTKHYWESIAKHNEAQAIRSFFDDESQVLISTAIINETIQRIKSSPEFQVNFQLYRKNGRINMKNGVFNVYTKKLEDYRETDYFTYVVNVKYTTNCNIRSCHSFLKFVQTSLETDVGDTKLQQLLEILAYLISDLEGAKLAFFFIGKGNSGKSVLLNLLRFVIGDEFCSTIAFNKLGSEFDTALLHGKRVNICSEVSCAKVSSPDIFKQVVSHDIISANRKNKAQITFRVETKLITAGNVLPRFNNIDGTDAVANRMLVVKFNKSIPKNEWIPDLDKKLMDEADKIFSSAVNTLADLERRNFVFTENKESFECIDQYKKSQNSLDEFVNDSCIIDQNSKIHKSKLWEAYRKYCMDNCYEILIDQMMFNDKIISLQGVSPSKFRLQGPPLAGYIGISLKEIV